MLIHADIQAHQHGTPLTRRRFYMPGFPSPTAWEDLRAGGLQYITLQKTYQKIIEQFRLPEPPAAAILLDHRLANADAWVKAFCTPTIFPHVHLTRNPLNRQFWKSFRWISPSFHFLYAIQQKTNPES